MQLDGKVVLITGGSKGIGRAFALAFAKEGARVAVVARHKQSADEVSAEIIRNGGEAISIQADISVEADVARMVEQTKARLQRIDILINNAAVNLNYRLITEVSLEEWNAVIGTNLTGTFLCCRAVIPEMAARGSGKIINMASIGGRYGGPGKAPYRAAKAAILNFTECVAAEVKKFGIDVNAICPAIVVTPMVEQTWGSNPPAVTPMEDIVDLALFLASDKSKAITGTAINAYGASNPLFGSVNPWTPSTKR